MEATAAYRKVLSEADDHSVVISAIGFATNLAALLQTKPDDYSSMNGYDLVAAKIKTIVWQGGWYPPIHGFGHNTYNWDCGNSDAKLKQKMLIDMTAKQNMAQLPGRRSKRSIR